MRTSTSRGLVSVFALVLSLAGASALSAQGTTAKPPVTKPATTKPATPAATPSPEAAAAATLIDINHATAKELKTIPGIGDAYAAKIIKGRPYANKSQLVSKNVLTQDLYDTIKNRLIAKQ